MTDTLYLSRIHFPVTALGPGNRIGIWFQGCSIRCVGCISADTWAAGRGATTVAEVTDRIAPWLPFADGITITGGEPFEQPDALKSLLRNVKSVFAGDVLVYTGFPFERVKPLLDDAAGLIDALISEPFDISAGQSLPLRGSDNQKLYTFTNRVKKLYGYYELPAGDGPSDLDVMFDDDGTVWFAGIPKRGDFLRLKAALTSQGHFVATSEASWGDASDTKG
ncbi:radical SAM protein [Rhodomicrobium udaipurense JA643]|uniref:Radical SAM protein n=1 Tax=Rhodomicrobium udaipurense TaxID=1202716 RepID=A0A8I1KKZ7_9HYPH|nr:4Fe-4S single cluster domain-containing protein [Rhodomicrobium udaipurense]KAI94682.1 radical SAM protein [Rhodomicrobium udaipurense JA643]MBJ7542578.1 radical SAM protein [Rhodomicrobium udaipurense]